MIHQQFLQGALCISDISCNVLKCLKEDVQLRKIRNTVYHNNALVYASLKMMQLLAEKIRRQSSFTFPTCLLYPLLA